MLNDFEVFKDLFNQSTLSAEALAEELDGIDDRILSYAKTCKNGEMTTKGFFASLEGMTLKAKAGQIALKGLSLVGNTLAGIGLSFAVTGLVKGIDYLINRKEKLKENLSNSIDIFESTTSKIQSLDIQVKTLGENTAKLQKLKDAGTISIADNEELQKLKEENDELERQIALLQDKQIQEAKQVLKDAEKQETDYVQSRYLLGNNLTPAKELWLGTQAYIYAINSGNDSLSKEHGERVVDMYNKIQPTLEAYRSLEKAGYTLSESEQKHFEELKKGEDAYLMYTYLTNNTKEAFVALNQEMQKSVMLRHLIMEKGMTEEQAGFVLDNIAPEDYENLYDTEFTPPALTDYATAEEYGKAYAEAWLTGIQEVTEEPFAPDKMSNPFQQAAEGIQSLTNGFNQLSSIYTDLTDGEDFDYSAFLNNKQFAETFGNLTNVSAEYKDAYDDFIESVSNSNGTLTSDAQSAFNKLAAAYIEHQSILNDVTEATRDTTVAQLEQMGVSNASAVIDEFLNVKKQKLAYASGELTDATYEEIQAMFATQDATSVAGKALAQLALEKLAVDGVKIDADEDIDEIIALANAAGSSALVIAKLEQAKKMINSESDGSIGWLRQYEAAERTIKEIEEGSFDFQIKLLNADDFKYTSAINSLSSEQETLADSTAKATDALEKQKSVLEDQKSEYESLHSAVLWFYDEQIEAIDDKLEAINEENEALEKQLETMDDILKAIEDNYDAEIQKIQDKIDALQDSNDEEERALKLEEAKRKLQEAKSRKTVLQYEAGKGFVYTVDTNAVKEAEEELEALQDEEIIHQLENEIDKLEEAKQKWLEIPEVYEKAMRELAAANYFGSDWRTTTLFPSDELFNSFKGGYIGNQEQIAENEERIEKLEQDKSYIEGLKETWEDAIQEYENQQNRAKLAAFFGSDYEYQLLNNSIMWQRQFVEEYSAICTEIEAIEERIKSMNDSGADLSNVIGAFVGGGNSDSAESKTEDTSSASTEESGDSSGLLGAIETVSEAIGSSEAEESLLGKLQKLDSQTLERIIAQFGLSPEEGNNLLSAITAVSNAIFSGDENSPSLIANIEKLGSDGIAGHIFRVTNSFHTLMQEINSCIKKIKELSSTIGSIPSASVTIGTSGGGSIEPNAKGGIITKKSAGDFDYLARAIGEDHTIAVQEGEAVIPKESVTRNKDVVLSLIDGKELAIDTATAPDTSVLPNLARALPKGITWNQIEFVKSAGLIPQFAHNVPDFNHELFAQTNNQQQTTTVQFHGDMIIQGVQDAEGFAKDMKHRFANIMTQELNKR